MQTAGQRSAKLTWINLRNPARPICPVEVSYIKEITYAGGQNPLSKRKKHPS